MDAVEPLCRGNAEDTQRTPMDKQTNIRPRDSDGGSQTLPFWSPSIPGYQPPVKPTQWLTCDAQGVLRVNRGLIQEENSSDHATPKRSDVDEYYRLLLTSRDIEIEVLKREAASYFAESIAMRELRNRLTVEDIRLGGFEEGAPACDLKEVYISTTLHAKAHYLSVFGGRIEDHDDTSLSPLLNDDQKNFLRIYGSTQNNILLPSVLYAIAAKAVDQRYCVGAIPALESLLYSTRNTRAKDILSHLMELEDAFRRSPDIVPRDLNVWRSSFTKLLLRLPQVKVEFCRISRRDRTFDNPEIDEIFDSIWRIIFPYVPEENVYVARKAVFELLRMRAEVRQKMRQSLSTYEFQEFKTGTPLDLSTMNIAGTCEEFQDSALDQWRAEHKGEPVVGLCLFPALYKYGNDQGYELDTRSVIYKAEVYPLSADDELFKKRSIRSMLQDMISRRCSGVTTDLSGSSIDCKDLEQIN